VFNQQLIGILDVDSPVTARFDDDDRQGLESLVSILQQTLISLEITQ
jgi:GAF domain-containing protein